MDSLGFLGVVGGVGGIVWASEGARDAAKGPGVSRAAAGGQHAASLRVGLGAWGCLPPFTRGPAAHAGTQSVADIVRDLRAVQGSESSPHVVAEGPDNDAPEGHAQGRTVAKPLVSEVERLLQTTSQTSARSCARSMDTLRKALRGAREGAHGLVGSAVRHGSAATQ